MRNRFEPAVRLHAKSQALPRLAAMADRPEHLGARQHQLHRTARHARREHAQDMRPCQDRFRSEAAADERRANEHVFRRDAEEAGVGRTGHVRRLVRRVERQAVAVPRRNDGVRLHRVVVLRRRFVGRVDAQRRRRQSRLDVAMRDARGRADPHGFRDETLDVQSDTRRLDLVSGLQERGAFRRRLQRLRNDERDRLVGVAHAVVLQRLQPEREEAVLAFRIASQRRPVGGGDHLHDMRMRFGGLDVEMRDAAARDRADGAHRIQHSFGMVVRGVGCAPGDLEDCVAAGERLAHVRAVAQVRRGLVRDGSQAC